MPSTEWMVDGLWEQIVIDWWIGCTSWLTSITTWSTTAKASETIHGIQREWSVHVHLNLPCYHVTSIYQSTNTSCAYYIIILSSPYTGLLSTRTWTAPPGQLRCQWRLGKERSFPENSQCWQGDWISWRCSSSSSTISPLGLVGRLVCGRKQVQVCCDQKKWFSFKHIIKLCPYKEKS